MERFGDNGLISIGFLIAVSFRDIIYGSLGFFPILNLFGSTGTGKSTLAEMLSCFYGHGGKGPNIQTATKAALADHVALRANALQIIEEYKNDIGPEKVEFLKSVFDGVGRMKMDMDRDKKKTFSSINCGIMLTGQEIPNVDPALFNRLIFLTFTKTDPTEEEKDKLARLRQTLENGAGHLVHQILACRPHFKESFSDKLAQVETTMRERSKIKNIEARGLKNWAILATSYWIVAETIGTEVSSEKFIETAVRLMDSQHNNKKTNSDVASFWSILESLAREGILVEGVHYKIELKDKEELRNGEVFVPDKPINILYLGPAKVFHSYTRYGSQAKINTLPNSTIRAYLTNSREFIGTKKSVRFKKHLADLDQGDANDTNKDYVTSALMFNYDAIKEEYEITLMQ
jgi:hypothetical protein